MNAGSLCMHCMQAVTDENGICTKCGKKESDIVVNPRHLPLGTIIRGKYLTGKVIGEGGFGITYVAYDLDLELRVAIKEYCPREYAGRDVTDGVTLVPFDTETKEFYQNEMTKFVGEAKRLARFRGLKGIVSVLDYFMENGTAYIVMEFIDGITLKDFMKVANKPMPVQTVFALMEPVISALEQVHKADVIHRDISPDNIMMSMDYKEIYLIDFGTARNISLTEEHSLSVYKKSSYTPPEQQDRHGNQGPWTDVYALCATIYYCITGKLIPEAVSRLLNDDVKRPSQLGIAIDPYMENALMKGLELRLENRFQSMEEFRNALYHPVEDGGKVNEEAVVAEAKVTEQAKKKTVTMAQEPNPFERASSAENTKKTGGKGKKVARFLLFAFITLGVILGMVSYSKCEKILYFNNYVSGAGLEYSYVRVEQDYTLTFLGQNRQLIEERIYADNLLVEKRTYTDEKVVCTFEDGSESVYSKEGYSGCSYEYKSMDGQFLKVKKWNNGWMNIRKEGFRKELFDENWASEHVTYEYVNSKLSWVTDHISGLRTHYYTFLCNLEDGGFEEESITEVYNADGHLLEKTAVNASGEKKVHEKFEYDKENNLSQYENLVTSQKIEYSYYNDRVIEEETQNGVFIDKRVTISNITEEPIILHYNEDSMLATIEGDQEAYLEFKKAEAAEFYNDAYIAAGVHALTRDAATDKLAERALKHLIKYGGGESLTNSGILTGEYGCYSSLDEPWNDLTAFTHFADNCVVEKKPGYKYHRKIGLAVTQVEDGWMWMVVFTQ